jgi:hypothetical protein
MARFADLISSIDNSTERTPAPQAEPSVEPPAPAPDPSAALAAAFGTVAAEPDESSMPATVALKDINDDLIPDRPTKGRHR